jgi:hypothetical protein
MARDPIHRRWHHDELTFGLLYAVRENFVLPLSHDEVVHGKGSLLCQHAGRRLAALRQACAPTTPSCGRIPARSCCSWAGVRPADEWNCNEALPLVACSHTRRISGVQALVRDLNRFYRARPALHARDCEAEGFRWIVVDDASQSVFAWLRHGRRGEPPVAVVMQLHAGRARRLPHRPARRRDTGARRSTQMPPSTAAPERRQPRQRSAAQRRRTGFAAAARLSRCRRWRRLCCDTTQVSKVNECTTSCREAMRQEP